MNILPFLFSFLVIFALSFNYSSERRQSTLLLHSGIHKLYASIHQSFSKQQSSDFQRACRVDPPPPFPKPDPIKQKDPEPKKKSPTYFRKDKCTYEEQKLNLSQFAEPAISSQHFQYKAAARLIRLLYQHTSFYYEGLELQVLDTILKRGDRSLSELFENNPALDAIFYKMLKGTSTYEIGKNKGYPSLLDYCCFQTSDNHLHYPDLSKPVLQALVGSDLMSLIEKQEQDTNTPMTETEFKDLLNKHSNDEVDKEYLLSVLQYGKVKKGKKTACVDDSNQMILRAHK